MPFSFKRPGCLTGALVCIFVALSRIRAAPLDPTVSELESRAALAALIPHARLLWCNRDNIFHSRLDPWSPQRISAVNEVEGRPRWSPDGGKILFERQNGNNWDVYVMEQDFSNPRRILSGAHTADWADSGRSVTAIRHDPLSTIKQGYEVLRYSIASGQEEVLHDAAAGGFNGWPLSQGAELHPRGRFLLSFTANDPDGKHHTYIIDIVAKGYLYNDQMWGGDCSPSWAPDGSFLATTSRTSVRPVLAAGFSWDNASVEVSEHLAGMESSDGYYIHDHRISPDGRWMTAGVLWRAGPLSGNREIYIWDLEDPGRDAHAVRVTFDTEEDHGPSLIVTDTQQSQPWIGLSPAMLRFSAVAGGPAPQPQTVEVENIGGGTLDIVTVSRAAGWLNVTASGEGNRQWLANSIDIEGLAEGGYRDTVVVSAVNATNSPRAYIVSLEIAPLRPADMVEGLSPGLNAQYYRVSDFRGMPRFDTLVSFRRDSVDVVDFGPTAAAFASSGLSDSVGAVFSGWFEAETGGEYVFYLASDDCARLLIGDLVVIGPGPLHTMREDSGTIGLATGIHAVRIEYLERAGDAALVFSARPPGGPKGVVAAENLWRIAPPVPRFAFTNPSGGERWPAGSVQVIEFDAENVEEAVIEFSPDNGKTWVDDIWQVQKGAPDWGQFPWTVPEAISAQCRLRLSTYMGEGEVVSERFEITAVQGVSIERAVRGGERTVRMSGNGGKFRTVVTVPAGESGGRVRLVLYTLRGERVAGCGGRGADGPWQCGSIGRGAYAVSVETGGRRDVARIVVP
jgi:hypothetical protein